MSDREVQTAQMVFLVGLVVVVTLAGMSYEWVLKCIPWCGG